jgi:hypothetical protein
MTDEDIKINIALLEIAKSMLKEATQAGDEVYMHRFQQDIEMLEATLPNRTIH